MGQFLPGILVIASLVGASLRPGMPPRPHPDFTGDYVLNQQRSTFGLEAARKIERGTVHIEHRDSAFTFRRVFVSGGNDYPLAFDLTADGNEAERDLDGRKVFVTLQWEADVLVARMRLPSPDGEASNVVRYRLIEGGRVLEADERFAGPRQSYHNVWVFDRVEAR